MARNRKVTEGTLISSLLEFANENLLLLPGERLTVTEIADKIGMSASRINRTISQTNALIQYVDRGAFAISGFGRLPSWAIDNSQGKEVQKKCVPMSAKNYNPPRRELAVITQTNVPAIDRGLSTIQSLAHSLAGKSLKDGRTVQEIESITNRMAHEVNTMTKENALLERLYEESRKRAEMTERWAEAEAKRANAITGGPMITTDSIRRRTIAN